MTRLTVNAKRVPFAWTRLTQPPVNDWPVTPVAANSNDNGPRVA